MKELHAQASAVLGASVEQCFALLAAVDRYPGWCPEVVRSVDVLVREGGDQPTTARATVRAGVGPLAGDLELLVAIAADRPRAVTITRLPNEASDPEAFELTWRVKGGESGGVKGGERTRIELRIDAVLSLPRLVPLAGVADVVARRLLSQVSSALAEVEYSAAPAPSPARAARRSVAARRGHR